MVLRVSLSCRISPRTSRTRGCAVSENSRVLQAKAGVQTKAEPLAEFSASVVVAPLRLGDRVGEHLTWFQGNSRVDERFFTRTAIDAGTRSVDTVQTSCRESVSNA